MAAIWDWKRWFRTMVFVKYLPSVMWFLLIAVVAQFESTKLT